jgi:agmatinase
MYTRDVLPSYAGPRTFLRSRYAEFTDLRDGMVAVLGVPWDTTLGSRPGTRYGPQAIRDSSMHIHYYMTTSPTRELVDLNSGEVYTQAASDRLVDLGDVNVYQADVERTRRSIDAAVGTIITAGAFPAILGGDHYITFPAFTGFARAAAERGIRRIGYIQFDAHFDLGSDNPIFGRHFHGSNARLAMESGLARPENFVWIGVRGYARREQYDFVKSSGAAFYSFHEVRKLGLRRAVEEGVARATAGTDLLYVTIDIDVVDPALAPGTGAINFGGITPMELLEAVELLKRAPVGAIDLVEVAPQWDPSGVTERLAAVALANFVGHRLRADQPNTTR